MKTILSIVLAFSLFAGCTAYHRHPVATVASVATLVVAPAGICVGIGDCGGEYGDTWQDNAAHYGIAQISVLAIIVASGVFAWADDWKRSE